MTTRLPPLRRRRRRFNLTAIASRFSQGVANVEATIEPFAQEWDQWNDAALRADGPLWVALGDSVTQGIGASAPQQSYPARVLDHLRDTSGQPWRLINLSMSGARFYDVVRHQLPAMSRAGLEPEVVSAVIGSNDVIWRRDTDAIVADARQLIKALPPGTILSRLGKTRRDHRRIGVNRVFDAAEEAGHIRLYRAWDWPTGVGMWAEDNFHPNDAAHGHLSKNLINALDTYDVL
jgi:lysophospholipase L1-like esterase